jgi:hypothetical protein
LGTSGAGQGNRDRDRCFGKSSRRRLLGGGLEGADEIAGLLDRELFGAIHAVAVANDVVQIEALLLGDGV